jgi:hypothetical protein
MDNELKIQTYNWSNIFIYERAYERDSHKHAER